MTNYKETYFRIILLKDDIDIYHKNLTTETDWNKKLRLFKNCFVSLDVLRDSFRHFNLLLLGEKELKAKAKNLKNRLEFINHLRNKIGGHLDEKVISKAVQWEPFIFNEGIKDNEEAMKFLIYKSLLESSINSYLNSNSKQKVFDTEIDLVYPPDQNLFFNYVGELNCDAIDFLTDLERILKQKIEFWDNKSLMNMAIKAGETDFNLKKK
ncbi:MAG: hypothetical protein WAT92_12800 [Saprospiraceae bacterium]